METTTHSCGVPQCSKTGNASRDAQARSIALRLMRADGTQLLGSRVHGGEALYIESVIIAAAEDLRPAYRLVRRFEIDFGDGRGFRDMTAEFDGRHNHFLKGGDRIAIPGLRAGAYSIRARATMRDGEVVTSAAIRLHILRRLETTEPNAAHDVPDAEPVAAL